MTARPDLFQYVVNNLNHGTVAEDLAELLVECVKASNKTGKVSSVSLTIKIKPKGIESGQYDLEESIKHNVPRLQTPSTLMFGTPEGNLQRNDPRQKEIEGLKSVDQSTPQIDQLKDAG